ncbi:hypothetical protein XENOCAPTIV_020435 [Xenoophorus captivus]|uniref:Uncharacterized protein n=1 Tax=Xenoophorus captivus TaxID=1517983 RepID=A0ABV0RCC0_9TELE
MVVFNIFMCNGSVQIKHNEQLKMLNFPVDVHHYVILLFCNVVRLYVSLLTFSNYTIFVPIAKLPQCSRQSYSHPYCFLSLHLQLELAELRGVTAERARRERQMEQFYTSKNKTFDRILCLRQPPLWFCILTQTLGVLVV